MTPQSTEFRKKIVNQKFPLLITFCFLIIVSYVAFFHHNFWIVDSDGIIYFTAGEQILNGDGKNVLLLNAPIGGPVFYAGINSVFNDGFFTMKLVSVLSATGMVFLSYNIMRNVFDSKIALAGQLLFAFFPWVGLFAIQAENEMFPLFLIMFSLYFITKKHLRTYEIIIIGSLIGIAFMVRAQPIVVLFTAIIYLLIRNSNIRLNLYHVGLILAFFIIFIIIVIVTVVLVKRYRYKHKYEPILISKSRNIKPLIIPNKKLINEIESSKIFCHKINSKNDEMIMCYPYGDYNDQVINEISKRGFKAGTTNMVGDAEISKECIFKLNRYDTNDFPQ